MTPIVMDIQWGANIDDLFSVALALCSPEIDLLGVTVVSDADGNGTRAVERLVRAYGRSVPVHRGSAKPHPEASTKLPEAVAFLIETVRRRPGEVTVITNGPLTNIAMAMERDPSFAGKVKEIITMAGWAKQPLAEWNVACDPAAMQRVLESEAPFVLFSSDVTTACRLNEMYLSALSRSRSPGTALLLSQLKDWQNENSGAPTLHDPLTVAYVCNPDLAVMESVRVALAPPGTVLSVGQQGKLTRLCRHVDTLRYFNMITERLGSSRAVSPAPEPEWSLHYAPPPYLYNALELEYPAGSRLELQARSEYQLLAVQRGLLALELDDAAYALETGDLFYIPAETSYSLATSGGVRLSLVFFHFHGGRPRQGADPLVAWETPLHIPPGSSGPFERIVRELVRAHLVQSVESVLMSKALLYELLALLTGLLRHTGGRGKLNPLQTQYVEAAKRIIEDGVTRRFSLDEIARAIGVSKYHLSRLFQLRYGMSPGEYHTQLRMRKAVSLLSMGHLSIGEIADQLGYGSVHSFSKAFKQHWGTNPSEYVHRAQQWAAPWS